MPSGGADEGGAPFGVYVHVPFCASKCDYCAFATWTDRDHLVGRYLDAMVIEIERCREAGEITVATSVFVGGGTPSLVPAAGLAKVLAAIERTPDAEVTVECNPDDVDEALLESYLAAGVNRISLGVQSMVPSVLIALGRRHDRANVVGAVEAIRRVGMPTFNLDIIYGASGERESDWAETVRAVIDLDAPHVSAYGLTVEAGTPLAADARRHPDDDDQAAKYEVVDSVLSAAGLENYEVSNWARPGHECRHNVLYWRQQDYRGIGCAAHSHRAGERWWNLRTPDRYLVAIERGESVRAGGETLDAHTRRIEGLQLMLRMRSGVPAEAMAPEDSAELIELGLLTVEGDRLALTRSGRLLANEVAMRLR